MEIESQRSHPIPDKVIVDGRKLSDDLYEDIRLELSRRTRPPKLSIITCAPNFETQKYLSLKQKKAAHAGIETTIVALGPAPTTDDVQNVIAEAAATSDGIVVQLPLPTSVDVDAVVATIPTTHDVDALNPSTVTVLSPVVGALKCILKTCSVTPSGKRVVIIGAGRLVGLPAERWFRNVGASVCVLTKDSSNLERELCTADIIVCGAGAPGLLRPDMVKEGVVILDAGTSEEGGVLRGDADPRCAEKASLFTPVPGGIGPVTVAVLFQNLVALTRE